MFGIRCLRQACAQELRHFPGDGSDRIASDIKPAHAQVGINRAKYEQPPSCRRVAQKRDGSEELLLIDLAPGQTSQGSAEKDLSVLLHGLGKCVVCLGIRAGKLKGKIKKKRLGRRPG